MDDDRFDILTRAVAREVTPRRSALRFLLGLAGAAFGGLAATEDGEAAGCRRHSQCGRCRRCEIERGKRRGRCVKAPAGTRCGACGECRDGSCRPDHQRCGRCQRCDAGTLTCVPAHEGDLCGECRTCIDGQCQADAARDGEPCRECGACLGGACKPNHFSCGNTTEDRCSYCRQDAFCTTPRKCAQCEICTQEGCVRDDDLRCGENRVCCGVNEVCCEAGEDCVNGRCCSPDELCGDSCCPDGYECCNNVCRLSAIGPWDPCEAGNFCCGEGMTCCGGANGSAACCGPDHICILNCAILGGGPACCHKDNPGCCSAG